MSFTILSDSWMESYLQDVIRMTARKVEVLDCEWKSALELLNELEEKYPEIAVKVRSFFKGVSAVVFRFKRV